MLELTGKDTKMIQGISVLAMVCLHLFCTLDFSELYSPLILINDIPLSFYFAQLCDFCVVGFAFCSGYAHMIKYGQKGYYKNRLIKLLYLLINFWLILIAFSLISICVGQSNLMPGSLQSFLGNFFLYRLSYNGAWWYMFTYSVIVIISPAILKAIDKINPVVALALSFIIYFGAYIVRFKLPSTNWFVTQFGTFGMTLFEYILGAVFYKCSILTKIGKVKNLIDAKSQLIFPIVSFLAFLVMLFGHTLLIRSLFIAPVTGCVIIIIFHFAKKPKIIQESLLFIGKHSTNIWLSHMFFYLCLFTNLAYIAKYAPLIFAFMLFLCIIVSIPINYLHSKIIKFIDKKINR